MQYKIHTSYRNFFKVEKVKPDGERILLADWFENTMLNQGLDLIGTGSLNVFSGLAVGSGTTASDVTDTTLETLVAVVTSNEPLHTVHTYRTSAPYYVETLQRHRFDPEEATGNIREMGLYDSLGGVISTRTLIKNTGGTPITLVIADEDALEITSKLRMYRDHCDSDGSGNFTIVTEPGEPGESEQVHAYTMRMLSIGASYGKPGPMKSSDSSCIGLEGAGLVGLTDTNMTKTASDTFTTRSLGPYIPGTFTRDLRFTAELDDGNFTGGIDGFQLRAEAMGSIQVVFTPAIMKTAVQILKVSFRYSWGQYTP